MCASHAAHQFDDCSAPLGSSLRRRARPSFRLSGSGYVRRGQCHRAENRARRDQRAKRKPPGSLDSYDYYLHGLANSYQDTKEANDQALRFFGKATELDPDFAAAYGMAALCYVERWWKRWMLDPQKEVAEAARLVNRAAALGRNDAVALSAAGMALGLVVRDLGQAVVLLDRSLLLNPNLAALGFAVRG